MTHEFSDISLTFTVENDYDIEAVNQRFHDLSQALQDHEFIGLNKDWALCYQLKLMPGIVTYQINGEPLRDKDERDLSFRVESIIDHAYQLLWGGAFSQAFGKPYALDIEGSGIAYDLTRQGDVLKMQTTHDQVDDALFNLKPLQFLTATAEHYERTIRTMLKLHKPLRAHAGFMRSIPNIRLIDYYASVL
ncbi:hypothetical protein [Fretibacter rubidus]|uniref:hypothetical protein n=1 Tax=Fretibacter rubidus TaxID=570162 RepID=UPI00352ADE37